MCRSDGKIEVLLHGKIPEKMMQLFTGNGNLSQNFRTNIRQYYNALSFGVSAVVLNPLRTFQLSTMCY